MKGCAEVRARTIVDARKYPWSAIGRINVIVDPRYRMYCSGVLVGERLVLTAAHCLYAKRRKKWVHASRIHFVAGFQRGEFVGHSTAVRYVVAPTRRVSGQAYQHRFSDDWALVELRDAVGARAGYLGWAALDQGGLERALRFGATVAVAGYPAIRKNVMSVETACKHPYFRDGGKLFIHGCAVMQGDSGAPILLLHHGKAAVVALISGAAARRNGLIGVSVPVANFYGTILKSLGGIRTVALMDGLAGRPGKAAYH